MLVKVYESDEFAEYIDVKSIIEKDDGNIFEVEEIVDFKTPKKTINEDSYNSLIVKAEKKKATIINNENKIFEGC